MLFARSFAYSYCALPLSFRGITPTVTGAAGSSRRTAGRAEGALAAGCSGGASRSSPRGQKARAAGSFESALSRLLVLRETYPELKSNESFLKLQDSLEGTENRLSVERKRYNDAVKTLNVFIRKPLGRFYAGLAGVEKAEYFEIEEAARTAPKVSFTETPETAGDR